MSARSLALLLSLVLVLVACGGDDTEADGAEADTVEDAATEQAASDPEPAPTEAEPNEEPEPEADPTEEEASAEDPRDEDAAALLGQLEDGRFNSELYTAENAPLFTHLAATETDPEVVRAAVDGMEASYRPVEAEGYALVDQEYLDVLAQHLTADSDPAVVLAAVEAASHGLNLEDGPDEATIQALLALAQDVGDPALDIAVVEQLWQADWETNPDISAFFLDAYTEGDPALTATVAFRLETASASQIVELDAFIDAALAQVGDAEEVVHGGALQALGTMGAALEDADPRRQEIFDAAVAGLDSPSAYVRGSAINVFESTRDFRGIPLIMEQLDDFAEGGLGSYAYTDYAGNNDSVGYDISPWSTPADAGLVALSFITSGTDYGFPYFDYDIEVGEDAPDVDAQLMEVAADAREWYAANQAAIDAEIAAAGG